MTYVPDMTERFPDAGEPAEEREYTINAWMPVQIQVDIYGVDKADAINRLKMKLKQSDVVSKIVDWDVSELEVSDIE